MRTAEHAGRFGAVRKCLTAGTVAARLTGMQMDIVPAKSPRLRLRRVGAGGRIAKSGGSVENQMTLLSELEELPPRELIETLSIRIYEPPLADARERILAVPSAFRVIVLVLDFDTEVSMDGMLGFLENSTGLYLAETIEAFDRIGARETMEVLRKIEAILERHGVSPAQLRADFEGTTLYQITTFNDLHKGLGSLPKEVNREAERLYVYAEPGFGEDVWGLLDAFVEANRETVLAEIARACEAW